VPRYFEDFQVGDVIECGKRTVTKEEIIAFAKEYDPQPIHVDEVHAAASHFGEVIASGLHMLGICMRQVVDTFLNDAVTLGSPGTEKFRFPKPLRPGRTVHVRARILEAVPSRSKLDRGNVKFAFELYDEIDGLLAEWVTISIFKRRPDAQETQHAGTV
jgi:acyl dehydratase